MLSRKIILLGTLFLLTGCGQKQLSSQQEPGHQTATSRSSQTTSSQAASHSSSAASQAPTATFKQQRFTIKDVTFSLTGSKVTASSTANRNLFVLYYSVTNHQPSPSSQRHLAKCSQCATKRPPTANWQLGLYY